MAKPRPRDQTAVGLFAGVGGIERGLERATFHATALCEIDPAARAVLTRRFPHATIHDDVTTLANLPAATVWSAGFPCQDLSQAGRRAGVNGTRFKLVDHVFRLIDQAEEGPTWLLLENVPFMLRLGRGEAMQYLTERLDERGWRWAYRTVDARAFGIPQRRERILLLASRERDPRPVLLGEDAAEPRSRRKPTAYGFYWTEGFRGLGLAANAVPPLKGGFGLGIPSAPAVWLPHARAGKAFGIPDLRDLERLQGFPVGWTAPAAREPGGSRSRWRLVGNAVCADVSHWAGRRLLGGHEDEVPPAIRMHGPPWPNAAWGDGTGRYAVEVSSFPRSTAAPAIKDFLRYERKPLSHRAATGFLARARRSSLTFPEGMLAALEEHIEAVKSRDEEGG